MRLSHVVALFDAIRAASGLDDFVVIGSLSILGLDGEVAVPDEMALSIDVDAWPRDDPGRVFELLPAFGERSDYHRRAGVYLDAVTPQLPTLPDGWEGRTIVRPIGAVTLRFLDPNDAAISKYARGEPRDLRWIRAGIAAGLVSPPIVRSRLRTTSFLDEAEAARVRAQLEADTTRRSGRRSGPRPGGR